MADITMCNAKNCWLAEDCKRKTAPVNPNYQSVQDFPVPACGSMCDWFEPNRSAIKEL